MKKNTQKYNPNEIADLDWKSGDYTYMESEEQFTNLEVDIIMYSFPLITIALQPKPIGVTFTKNEIFTRVKERFDSYKEKHSLLYYDISEDEFFRILSNIIQKYQIAEETTDSYININHRKTMNLVNYITPSYNKRCRLYNYLHR